MAWSAITRILTSTRLLGGNDAAPLNVPLVELEGRTDAAVWRDPVNLVAVGTIPVVALTIPFPGGATDGQIGVEVSVYGASFSGMALVRAHVYRTGSGQGSASLSTVEGLQLGANVAFSVTHGTYGLRLSITYDDGNATTKNLSVKYRPICAG